MLGVLSLSYEGSAMLSDEERKLSMDQKPKFKKLEQGAQTKNTYGALNARSPSIQTTLAGSYMENHLTEIWSNFQSIHNIIQIIFWSTNA